MPMLQRIRAVVAPVTVLTSLFFFFSFFRSCKLLVC